MTFTDEDSSQATKGAVHGALLTVAAFCAVYNACAWHKRCKRHLKVNTLVYAALIAWEVWQIKQHVGSGEE